MISSDYVLSPHEKELCNFVTDQAFRRTVEIIEHMTQDDVRVAKLKVRKLGLSRHAAGQIDRAMLAAAHMETCLHGRTCEVPLTTEASVAMTMRLLFEKLSH